jgi:hypothetical protein
MDMPSRVAARSSMSSGVGPGDPMNRLKELPLFQTLVLMMAATILNTVAIIIIFATK